jgi:tetratricopeptide (TPR) repeat protein
VFAGSGDLFRAHHHWLTFMAGSVLRTDELATAIREHPTENLYGPFIWYYHAGRGGPCVVPPEYLVAGSTAISWGDLRATVMTLHFAGLFDEAVGLDLTPHEFGRLLDDLYGSEELLELWRQVPADTFESVVRRFPTSRTLRWLLWTRAREERRDDWLATVAGAVEESGATVEALELVRQGEEIYLQGDAAGALPLFDAAVRLAPTLATGWTDLGVVRHALWLPDAVEAFDLALACAPNDVDALLNRARVVLEAGDGARARDDVDHVLNLEPANETALELARVLGLA